MNREQTAKLLKSTGLAVLKWPDGGVVTQRTANPLSRADFRHSSHNSPSVPRIAFQGLMRASANSPADNAPLGTTLSFPPKSRSVLVKTGEVYPMTTQADVKTKMSLADALEAQRLAMACVEMDMEYWGDE
jgi:hypothetical protein